VPVEVIADHTLTMGAAGQTSTQTVSGVRETPVDERPQQQRVGGREDQKTPPTLGEHMADVRDRKIARFLSPDYAVLLESSATDLEGALRTLGGDVEGVVVDRVVDQRLLDQISGKNLEFVAARDFKGIIKRPLSIRLIKIG